MNTSILYSPIEAAANWAAMTFESITSDLKQAQNDLEVIQTPNLIRQERALMCLRECKRVGMRPDLKLTVHPELPDVLVGSCFHNCVLELPLKSSQPLTTALTWAEAWGFNVIKLPKAEA